MICIRPESNGDSWHGPEKEKEVKAWDGGPSIWLIAGSSRYLSELVMRNIIIMQRVSGEPYQVSFENFINV